MTLAASLASMLVTGLLVAASTSTAAPQTAVGEQTVAAGVGPAAGHEPYRPAIHFTPEKNWMNDPNGMVFHDGVWHLYFQHNPFGDRWGNMSWGHATSTDLVHWQEQPLAIAQGEHEDIFSGSVVVDHGNTSGFGTMDDPPLVALYTSAYTGHPEHGDDQAQSLAYSTDGGYTWTKYAGNPVLDRESRNFRDPKVFWYDGGTPQTSYWVMVAVEAVDHQVLIYRSDNLLDWDYLSTFGPANATTGIWECPDLFELPIDGDPDDTRWVMVVNLNPGAVAGGSGGQYFVGDFDGTTFTSESTVSNDRLPEGELVADFEDGWDGWEVSDEPDRGGPFGDRPADGSVDGQLPVTGFAGNGLINSFRGGDGPVGTVTSPSFTLTADHVSMLVGGGRHPRVSDKLDNSPPPGDLLFDFEPGSGSLADTGWTSTGDLAASAQPSDRGGEYVIGEGRVNTFETGVEPGDDRRGTLTSPGFPITRDHLSMLVGGGRRPADAEQTLEVQLLIDNRVVRRLAGDDSGVLNWKGWDVADLRGSRARLRVVDEATGGWGHLTLDHVVAGDRPTVRRSDETTVNLVVDGEVVRTATGADSETLDWRSWDVSDLRGQSASIRVVDNNRGGWGHVLVDHVVLTDTPARSRLESYDWLDWGRDYYATVSFDNAPDDRRVMLGWMSNWQYAEAVPTSPWRSAMALPREVELTSTPRGPRLVQSVVPEVDDLGWRHSYRMRGVGLADGHRTLPRGARGQVQRIDVVLRPGDAEQVGLAVHGDADGSTRIGYDTAARRLFVDRTDSGAVDFHPTFPSVDSAPVPLRRGVVELEIYLDRGSVEVFADGGRVTLTDLVFPSPGADRVGLYAVGDGARVESLTTTPLAPSMFVEDFARAPDPRVVGAARVGGALVARTPGWRPAATRLRLQWLADGRPLPGRTYQQLRVRPGLVGQRISVRVTAQRDGYRTTSRDSAVTAPVRRW